nr:EAL domain-containing protein [Saccharofermentans sp.]
CVWTNEPGRKLLGGARNDYESVKDNLTFLFGDIDFDKTGWSKKLTLGTGDETQYTRIEMRSVNDEFGKNTGSYLSVRDITEEQNEIKLEMYRSTHDSLTDLYTKEYLYESIEKRLKNDKKTDYMIGYMEISNYKVINDVFGKRFGDLTVAKTADFIREGARGKSLAGRLSEDSFGILIDKEDFLGKPVEEKISTFKVSDKDLEHRVIFHYGIYDISEGEDIDVPLFFDSARLATTRIADPYQTQLVYYDDKMRNEIIHDQLISSQLQDAINTKQIRPFLQPIVDEKGLLSGAEALVRWIHPDEGLMPPGKFIPVFERSGQIVDVDKHMWRSACEILKDWQERGFKQFISVNISPKDFYFLDVAEELKNLVEEYKIDPKQLRIEITETVMMDEAEERFKVIEDLRRCGFIIEMDDFGSGFSSLNLLKDMPVDVLKIDMQFLRDSERNLKAGFIIKNIIRMSDDLGIDTLTEGVETAAQFEKLYAMGCKLYQGYYFSKPVPVEDFEKQWFD